MPFRIEKRHDIVRRWARTKETLGCALQYGQYGTEHPTEETIQCILDARDTVKARRVHFGLCGAGLYGRVLRDVASVVNTDLRETPLHRFIETDTYNAGDPNNALSLLVFVHLQESDIEHACLMLAESWAGVLILGERPGTGQGIVNTQAWYQMMSKAGWISRQRTMAPSLSLWDVTDQDLVLESEVLLGHKHVWRSVQELYTKHPLVIKDPRAFHSWYDVSIAMDALSLTQQIRQWGEAALVPFRLTQAQTLLTTLRPHPTFRTAWKLLHRALRTTHVVRMVEVHRLLGEARLDVLVADKALLDLKCALADPAYLKDPTRRAPLVAKFMMVQSPKALPACWSCLGPVGSSTSTCTQCELPRYCDSKCQLAHWDIHKETCQLAEIE